MPARATRRYLAPPTSCWQLVSSMRPPGTPARSPGSEAACTGALGVVVVLAAPASFVAVISARSVWPTSAAVGV